MNANRNAKRKVFHSSKVPPPRLTRAELRALKFESEKVYVTSLVKPGESAQKLKEKLNALRIDHVKKSEDKKNQRTRQSIQQGSGSIQQVCNRANKAKTTVKQRTYLKGNETFHIRRRNIYRKGGELFHIRSEFHKKTNTIGRKLAKLLALNRQIIHRTEGNNAAIEAVKNKAEKTFKKGWAEGGPVPAKPSDRVKHLVVLFVTLSVTFFTLFQMVATGQLSQSEREGIQQVMFCLSNSKYCYNTQFDHNMAQVPEVPPSLQAVVTTVGPALLPLPLLYLLMYAIYFQQEATSIGGRVPAGVISTIATAVEHSNVVNPTGLSELLKLTSDLGPAWHD
jgi:hypothetical protein